MENKKEFPLDLNNIRSIIEFITDSLNSFNPTRRDVTLAQLFVEETIAYWAKKASPEAKIEISFRKRFKTISLVLSYAGPAANPMALEESADLAAEDLIGSNILIGLSQATYAYKNGINKISFTIKQKQINSTLAIIGALIGGSLLALLANQFFPDLGYSLANKFLNPLSNTYFGLLNGLVLPLLFVSVLSGIFNMENLSQIKQIFGSLLRWLTGFTMLAAAIGVIASLLYFPIAGNAGQTVTGESAWSQVLEMVFGIMPTNLIRPFLEGNTLQIIFLAVFIGVIMLTMKGRFPIITDFVAELNLILANLLSAVVALMPWFIFISIFNLVLSGNTELILSSLEPIILILICFAVLIIFMLASVLVIEKINPVKYLKTIGPSLLIGLVTASSGATFSQHSLTARVKQNVRDYVAKFAIPLGSIFSKAFVVPFLIIVTLFIGKYYGIIFSLADLSLLTVLCVILAISVPPVPGMGSYLFTVIFMNFGIPMESLAMAITIFVLFDYLLTPANLLASNVSMLHVEKHLRNKDKVSA